MKKKNMIMSPFDAYAISSQTRDDRLVIVAVCHNIGFPACIEKMAYRKSHKLYMIAFVRDGSQAYLTPEISDRFDWIIFYNENVPFCPFTSCHFPELDRFIAELLTIVKREKVLLVTFEQTVMDAVADTIARYRLKWF
ncbi:hypothetical protein QR680_015954 [Steinernema hermaphroditum]|uniref:Uncharacterized protein n=1 Tax=Steinernema hermaphroditum TaxID=289476 RepID=A0AA39H9J0_9BILA|nr:hypothetical protein QR680_015954 [Steinernema hermaphroditum]